MEFIKNRKFLLMLGMFIAILAGIILSPKLSGVLLIFAIIAYGSLSIMWKEREIKLSGLVFLLLLSLANIGVNGLRFGIDFSGGTRIPVILEHSVDSETMNELVQTIKKRVSVLGLSEAKVRAIGDTQVNVEIPSGKEEEIKFIEDTLSKQGVYWGIVDGEVAISGENIFSTSIRSLGSEELTYSRADWGVAFSVNRKGAEQFGNAAKGKADYPVYMFLDRPTDAVLFLSRAELRRSMLQDSSEKECKNALSQALKLNNGNNITLVIIDDEVNKTFTPKTNKTQAIISSNTDQQFKQYLNNSGFTIKEFSDDEIAPSYNRSKSGVLVVSKLEAIGLMSAPFLEATLTTGNPTYSMSITGGVPGAATSTEKSKAAQQNVKKIVSILKGGSLPVPISLGSRTTLPASLGSEFLRLSLIGIGTALIIISIIIGLRYMNLRATTPIVIISLSELAILLSILGAFTIDLAAMAGIMAAIGVGVDAQIVITDELLKKDKRNEEEKINDAFAIIKTNVIVAILSMLPLLLFSGLVEVIGFAISTILGAVLGYMLSRPAYAAIFEIVVGEKHEV